MDENNIDVFLSYASEDKGKASAIADGLKLHGLNVWWDTELKPGDEFSEVIQRRLDAARTVVVLWSVSSAGGKKRFVKEEAARAQFKLVPVLLDETQPPLGFGQISHVNLRRWNGDGLSPDLDLLVEGIRKIGRVEMQWRKPATWLVLRSLFRDFKTRIALCLMTGMFLAAWLAWGRIHWHEADMQWAILLALWASLAWFLIRGSRLARSRAGSYGAAGLSILALATWVYGIHSYYKVPEFSANAAGILVGRFSNDLDDKKQLIWIEQMQAFQASESALADAREPVAHVSIEILRREIPGNDKYARRVLKESGALLAIWGNDNRQAAMTFADLPGFAKLDGLAIAPPGSVAVDHSARPNPAVSQSVLLFSAAFAAFRDERYENAQQLLERIPKLLSDNGTMLTSPSSMLATAYLLLGNVHMLAGCKQAETAHCVAAIDNYMKARDIFTRGDDRRGSLFVEASNNFAVAASKLTSSFITAQGELEESEQACRVLRHDPPLACTFVRYNLALLANETAKYDVALGMLAEVCESNVAVDLAQTGSAFVGGCNQQRGYSAAKLGETAQSDEAAAGHFIAAKRFLDLAAAALPENDHSANMLKISITRARVAIGQRDFAIAKELLGPLVTESGLDSKVAQQYPELDAPEITAMYSVARACVQPSPSWQVALPEGLSPATLNYLSRRIEGCSAVKEKVP